MCFLNINIYKFTLLQYGGKKELSVVDKDSVEVKGCKSYILVENCFTLKEEESCCTSPLTKFAFYVVLAIFIFGFTRGYFYIILI